MGVSEVSISLVLGLIKGAVYIYDVVTYLPWLVFARPGKVLQQSSRVKARPTGDSPDTPYRDVDSFATLTCTLFPECQTLDDLFRRAILEYGPNQCLGTRELLGIEDEVQRSGKVFKKQVLGEYKWMNYETMNRHVSHLGSGLLALGQTPRSNILIFAETRAEWMIAAQACFRYNFPLVTLYATLGDEAIVHGINESEVSFVITSNTLVGKLEKLLPKMPTVRHVIYMDYSGSRVSKLNFPSNVEVTSMTEVEATGAKESNLQSPIASPTRDDLAVIMYTSGSTGLPKGVLITHGNLMAGLSGQCSRIPNLGFGDTYIAYLPLAHVLELCAEIGCISLGTQLGYSSATTLSDQSTGIKKGCKGDASVLRPTLMAAVPVIMDRIYKNVWEKVNSGGPFTKQLFQFAYDYKLRRVQKGFSTPICDRTIFKKIRALLGGRLRHILSGGAPLSKDTQLFMNICFCCPVGQGYGLTETCGAGTVADAADLTTGRVGAPLPCNELKLVNWDEGGYFTTDKPNARGEVAIGGPNVTMGYYKNPEKTDEDFKVIDGQRWFFSGDIGEVEPDGVFKIIDRKKDLVKLQLGEYVSLSKVETVLKMHPIVDNICVYADSNQYFTVCLLVPNHKQLCMIAERLGVDSSNFETLCQNTAVNKEVLGILQQQAKGKLEKFETPQKVTLCTETWLPGCDLVTDAFKLKRKNIQQHYRNEISTMYG